MSFAIKRLKSLLQGKLLIVVTNLFVTSFVFLMMELFSQKPKKKSLEGYFHYEDYET